MGALHVQTALHCRVVGGPCGTGALAQELNFKVVAEGIETESEEVFMKGLGVDYVQGFLYGQAMPTAEFERWLQDRQKLRLIA